MRALQTSGWDQTVLFNCLDVYHTVERQYKSKTWKRRVDTSLRAGGRYPCTLRAGGRYTSSDGNGRAGPGRLTVRAAMNSCVSVSV